MLDVLGEGMQDDDNDSNDDDDDDDNNDNKVMLDASGEGMQDQEMFNLRSTCHIALDRCERDSNCR